MQPKFSIVSDTPRKARTARKAIPRHVGILEMFALAWERPIAMIFGCFFGAIVSFGTFEVWHCELHTTAEYTARTFLDPRFVLVLGGLAYSVGTVSQLAYRALGARWKAIAFTVFLESLMVLSTQAWLTQVGLCYLCALNALGTGVVIARKSPVTSEARE